jgi:hypothetical protein
LIALARTPAGALIIGSPAAASGLPGQAWPATGDPAGAGTSTLSSDMQIVVARPAHEVNASTAESQDPSGTAYQSLGDGVPRGPRGPQGGAQASGGGGGMATPLLLAAALALAVTPLLKFVPCVDTRSLCVEAGRLERPG